MIKYILALFLSVIFILPCFTQDLDNVKQNNGSKIEALKIAFLTRKLNLSPEEAQRFWPVYNQYSSEIQETRKDQRKNSSSELETEDKILSIRKKYNIEFGKILGTEKADLFFRSEKDFSGYVQRELMERRAQRQLQMQKQKPN